MSSRTRAGLVYRGQSGALNESIADVFGSLAEQHHLGQTVDEASWLIGEGIFTDAVEGRALRSLAAPGTAYDDDVLGRDPQPAHMDGYVVTRDDNGGVHINSGIPNHAFYLTAMALGGHAWERAGRIWYRALTSGTLPSTADFTTFANATLAAAEAEYGEGSEEVDAVRAGWTGVGVLEDGPDEALTRLTAGCDAMPRAPNDDARGPARATEAGSSDATPRIRPRRDRDGHALRRHRRHPPELARPGRRGRAPPRGSRASRSVRGMRCGSRRRSRAPTGSCGPSMRAAAKTSVRRSWRTPMCRVRGASSSTPSARRARRSRASRD